LGAARFILLLIPALPDGRFLLLFSLAKHRTPIDNQIERQVRDGFPEATPAGLYFALITSADFRGAASEIWE